jgi:hypothetical protein
MDSPDEQQPQQPELPTQQPTSPVQRPTTFPTVTVQELEQQCQDLKTLLTATWVALLVLAMSLNLFLIKQMRMVRAKVTESRPAIQRLQAQFREKEPNMKSFIVALQTFAATHRDFQPVLDKYRYDLPQYLAPPAAAASTTPPGVKVPGGAATSAPVIQPVRPGGK